MCCNAQQVREIERDVDMPVVDATKGIFTTEFWMSAVTVAGNIMLVLVMLGQISKTDADTLTTALQNLATTLPGVLANGFVVWSYIQSRIKVKQSIENTNTARLEIREKLRMEMRTEQLRMAMSAPPQVMK